MPRNELTRADRAVYALIERGGIDAAHAALYRREITKLGKARLVQKGADGVYTVIASKSPSTAPPAPIPSAKTAALVVRVPQEWIDLLDARGPTRSLAAREFLGDALARAANAGSGTRERITA